MRIKNRYNRITGSRKQRSAEKRKLWQGIPIHTITYEELHPFEQVMADNISKNLLKYDIHNSRS